MLLHGVSKLSYKLSCIDSSIVNNPCLAILYDRKFVGEIVSLYPAWLLFFSGCSASEDTK